LAAPDGSRRPPQPSAVQWLRRLESGEISAVELVTQTAERIQAADESVHAVVAWNPERSLTEAREADARRRRGERLPLLGLPLTVKDSIDVANLRCTGGSFARACIVPEEDATVVARLRAAGAIIVAKTNVPEYSSSYETDNALFGRTNHPLDSCHTPGGSSGGEGALLGADASVAGIGIDGGGSIRVPSHYCGIAGLRPTVGRIPDTGTWPATRDTGYRDLMCVGPMCRYVEDLGLLLPVMAGPDWIDPYAVPAPLADAAAVSISALRAAYYECDGIARVSPGTRAAVTTAARALAAAGAEVSEIAAPAASEATELFFALAGADGGARTLRDLDGSNGRHHEQFQTLIDGFADSIPLSQFFDLQGRMLAFRTRMRRFVRNYDVVLAPVTTGPAPHHMEPPYGIPHDAYYEYAAFNYVHTYALAGVPVAVVPAGVEEGFPIGVQIIGSPYREDVVLAAAAAIEREYGGFPAAMAACRYSRSVAVDR